MLGLEPAGLISAYLDLVDEERRQAYLALIRRRAAGEPVQHLTGHQEFYGLDFVVTPDVLIPRPETEFLVEQVIKLARVIGIQRPRVIDLGTGSGCVAISIARNIESAQIIASDFSPAALRVARLNAERLGVLERIDFCAGDMFDMLNRNRLEQSFDFVVMNPPYIQSASDASIQREVLEHEPGLALFGGPDGLRFHRRLLDESLPLLTPGGFLIFEIGFSQADAVSELIPPDAWITDVIRDLQGIPRVFSLKKK